MGKKLLLNLVSALSIGLLFFALFAPSSFPALSSPIALLAGLAGIFCLILFIVLFRRDHTKEETFAMLKQMFLSGEDVNEHPVLVTVLFLIAILCWVLLMTDNGLLFEKMLLFIESGG